MTLELALVTLLPATMAAAGAILFTCLSRPVRREHGRVSSWVRAGRALAGMLVLGGILLAGTVMTHVLAVFFWIAVLMISAAAILRFRQAERQGLLWALLAAAERSIPLHESARAFASERHDSLGVRAERLADYLEAGVPLGLALQRSGIRVSPDVRLAADLGQHTGTLATSLRTCRQGEEVDAVLNQLVQWLFYFGFLLVSAGVILTFTFIKVVPVLLRMFRDLQLELPSSTVQLVDLAEAASRYWYLLLLVIGLGFGILLLALAHFVGCSIRHAPLARRLWWRVDRTLVLRWLAAAVRQRRSVGEMTRLLAGYFPEAGMRRRLEQAGQRMDRGGDWCDSLRQSGLIGRSEMRLFEAAQRTGHLPWALEEMADSGIRRFACRFRAALDILLPAALVLFGGAVFFIALALLLPLFHLIVGLT